MKNSLKIIMTLVLYITSLGQSYGFGAMVFEGGFGDDNVRRGGFGVQWEWPTKWFAEGDWYLGGYSEVSFSLWIADSKGKSGDQSLGDFGFTPVFRYQPHQAIYGIKPYIEAAVGLHMMTGNELGDKDYSINFTFGDHLGTGFRFGDKDQYEFGYRIQHLSNAGLGDSNPGINFHLFRFGFHF